MARLVASSILILAATTLSAGCGRPSTERNVRQALEQANIGTISVDVDEEARIVPLSGTVNTLSDRTRAEEVAAAAVGTSGRVLNDLTVASIEDDTANDYDGQVTKAVDAALDADRVLRERDVNIAVNSGTVTVTGEVRSEAERNRVTRVVKSAAGVKDVVNTLAINRER